MSAETAAVSTAAHVGRAAEPKRRSGGSGRSHSENSGSAGVGALRGVPAGMGRARRRLDRGERLFPGQHVLAHRHSIGPTIAHLLTPLPASD